MQLDMTCIADMQLTTTFNLDADEVDIEIMTLQSDIHLKAHQDSLSFGALWTQKSTYVYAQQL